MSDSEDSDDVLNYAPKQGDIELDYIDNEELLVSIRKVSDINEVLFTIDLKSLFIKHENQ